jgi:8-oxo-dGTP diphosphatase
MQTMKSQRTRVSAYALIREANRLLLCRISNDLPRWAGVWTLPGGGLNFGEDPEIAVVREVEEETGLKVQVRSVAKVDSIFESYVDEDFHGIRIIYRADVVGGELRHESAGTTDRCEWHPLHPTPDILLGDLATVGIHLAQKAWPLPGPGGAGKTEGAP